MRAVFTATGWSDYTYWQQVDRAQLERINKLIEAILRDPFDGIGKPEQLRHGLSGAWSRRISEERRLVYVVKGDDVIIFQARYHYEK
ncbi:Txe/YoeB family addiction module toxin [Catenulispora subtropica]|uniref:Endoribonuclease YoeB n=1 Tax=Catenulispora subtropica TaxID=450798 RepID=A0ABN2R2V2_9ACTN